MRVLPGLVASCLAGIAASSTVFELYHEDFEDGASFSPDEFALALSQRAGVSRYHRLGSHGVTRMLSLGGYEEGMGMFEDGMREHFVLSIAGTTGVGASQSGNKVRIGIKDMPRTSAFGELMEGFVQENRQFLEGDTAKIVDMSPWGGMCVGVSENEISLDPKEYAPDVEFLGGALGTPSEEAEFLREYVIIQKIIGRDIRSLSGHHLAACHVRSVEKYVKRYGPDSREATTAANMYLDLSDSIPSHVRSTIIHLPVTKSTAGVSAFKANPHKAHRRSEEPLSLTTHSSPSPSTPASEPLPKRILGPIPSCYTSQKSCTNATDACSGRGECVKSKFPMDCWTCSCKGPDGKKTDKWAGAACQKEDISVPFNLFLILGVLIVLVSVWAVGLLYSIGDEPLPSVLSAGVAPAKRG